MLQSKRLIRSFVRRKGRITQRQTSALSAYLPIYGLKLQDGIMVSHKIFFRQAPLILEIGFGMGGTLIEMAEKHPEQDYIGIEVYRPGVGNLLATLGEKKLSNIRVFCEDAVSVLQNCISDNCLTAVYIFFPDPWPKKRHHKRRLIQSAFMELIKNKLIAGGILHLATDWEEYAKHMLEVISTAEGWKNIAGENQFHPRPEYRPITKFERRGEKLGYRVLDLLFEKK